MVYELHLNKAVKKKVAWLEQRDGGAGAVVRQGEQMG